jgi:hypothetical protein
MGFQPVEFEFPHEENEKPELEIESSSAETLDLDAKPKKEAKKEPKKEDVEIIEEDGVEIEVVDDTPKKDRGRKPSDPPEEVTEDELQDYSEKVRKRIQHFSKGYHDERRAKEQALRERQELERMAQQLVEENKRLKGDNNKSRTVLLEQAKKNASSELNAAKAQYKEAYESGDAEAVLAAQEALTNAKIKADKLENFKLPALQEEETQLQVNTNEETQQATPPVQTDERATSWAENNPWFGSDDEMTAYALGLHNKLVKSGIDPTSDEYYEKIDSRMRSVFPDEFVSDEEIEQEAQPAKRQSNVVAPATRSTAPKKVKLTQTQIAIAKRLGVPLTEYASQAAALGTK